MEMIPRRDEKLMVGSTMITSVTSTAEEFRSEFLKNSSGTISHLTHPAHLYPTPFSLSSTCSSPCLSSGTYPSPSPTNNGSFTFSKSEIMKNYHHSPRNGNENGWGIGVPYPSPSSTNAGSFSFSNSDQNSNNYVKSMQGKKNLKKYKLGYPYFSQKKFASSGNRTRAARVAGEHSTTEPMMLDIVEENKTEAAGNLAKLN